jgi:hypothetical protein
LFFLILNEVVPGASAESAPGHAAAYGAENTSKASTHYTTSQRHFFGLLLAVSEQPRVERVAG